MPVPSGGGGIGRDACVLIFEGRGVWACRVSKGRTQVATVRADEPKPARTESVDVELSGVMGDVVAFTQQQQIVQVGAATVDPVDAVVGVQVRGVRAARMGAMTVLTQQGRGTGGQSRGGVIARRRAHGMHCRGSRCGSGLRRAAFGPPGREDPAHPQPAHTDGEGSARRVQLNATAPSRPGRG